MIILVGGQKGGVGKSTIAIYLAVRLKELGNEVILIDADAEQKSTHRWSKYRDEAIEDGEKIKRVECVIDSGNLRSSLPDYNKTHQYVVVDVPGRDSREFQTGLTVADLLINPVSPNAIETDTLTVVNTRVRDAMDFNPSLRALSVLNKCSSHPKIKKADEAEDRISNYEYLPLLKTRLHYREAYADAYAEGFGVTEWDNKKATNEFNNFFQELGIT